MRGPESSGGLHDAIDPPAEDAFVGAGHADVALKGRAAREDLLVGGGHVGVRAQNGANAPVQMPAHQLLVTGGFGVKVDQDHADIGRQGGQHAVGGREGAIDRRHEDPAQKRKNRHADLVPRSQDGKITAWSNRRKVGRTDDPPFALQDRKNFPPL